MSQFKILLPELYRDKNRGANILFRGPSGYGKTTLAIKTAEYLVNGKDFESYWADSEEFRFQKRVIFIDEVHRVKNHESLFPVMDEKSHILLFATNHDAALPEAFSNRCWEYVFDEYSDEELILIARENSPFSATDESYLEIIDAGNRNPRIIKALVDKLGIYFSTLGVNSLTANFREILSQVFKIENGLGTLERRYLEVLEDVGGTASLSLMKNILHVDEGTLIQTVEPVLLRKGRIRITSKGRTILYANL